MTIGENKLKGLKILADSYKYVRTLDETEQTKGTLSHYFYAGSIILNAFIHLQMSICMNDFKLTTTGKYIK